MNKRTEFAGTIIYEFDESDIQQALEILFKDQIAAGRREFVFTTEEYVTYPASLFVTLEK